ncbi:MAG: preprotein translocase subunit YajC [Anaerolineales bacterium]|nr:MAG: preprotein translocase subunit YajC [Anaerolineales bacterium]
MEDSGQLVVWFVVLALMGAVMFVPQWRARRRRKQQMAELGLGDEVMTVGGIVGRVTELDTGRQRARLQVAPGVEIEILLAAIGRKIDES